MPKPDHSIFAYTEHPDLQFDLASVIQSLPEKYREATFLRDFEELSIAEIAEQLRLTRAAVKSHIHRGRRIVQEYL